MGSEITLTFAQIKKSKEIVNFKARKSRAQSSWPAQGGARVAIQMGWAHLLKFSTPSSFQSKIDFFFNGRGKNSRLRTLP